MKLFITFSLLIRQDGACHPQRHALYRSLNSFVTSSHAYLLRYFVAHIWHLESPQVPQILLGDALFAFLVCIVAKKERTFWYSDINNLFLCQTQGRESNMGLILIRCYILKTPCTKYHNPNLQYR